MHTDSTMPVDSDRPRYSEDADPGHFSEGLVRLKRPIVVNPDGASFIDHKVVASRFYNCFNYSLLSPGNGGINLAVGVTSANTGEGKTLVASNLAVSLAIANQRETVLVDLNLGKPSIHTVFGAPQRPGLVEAFYDGAIHLSKTPIKDLYILGAGGGPDTPLGKERSASIGDASSKNGSSQAVQLEHLAAFRDVIYSLKEQFDFIIVDMPSIHEHAFPVLFTNYLDGILVVVDAGRTKQEDIEHMFRHLNERQVLGFVMNRVGEEYYSHR